MSCVLNVLPLLCQQEVLYQLSLPSLPSSISHVNLLLGSRKLQFLLFGNAVKIFHSIPQLVLVILDLLEIDV